MSKSRDKSNRAYTKDKKGRRKYVDSASRYAQSSKVHLMQWFQVCIFYGVLTLYTVQCTRNMLTNFMCWWRRCRVNNSELICSTSVCRRLIVCREVVFIVLIFDLRKAQIKINQFQPKYFFYESSSVLH